jgi:hypothetical protein
MTVGGGGAKFGVGGGLSLVWGAEVRDTCIRWREDVRTFDNHQELAAQEARRVAQCPPGPACRSTIQIEMLLFDSERQLCPRHGRNSNRHGCGAHSSSHHREHDASMKVAIVDVTALMWEL